jgi:tetrapyrrole methylase family protein / MazG family protein
MRKISIIGLGAGDLRQMPLGVFEKLSQAKQVFLRTEKHPVVDELKKRGIPIQSFDEIYLAKETFPDVYETISDQLIEQVMGSEGEILYAVPGHPMVAEKTTQWLLKKGPENGITVEVMGGQSFLDAMFTALKIDPVEGFALLDGLSLKASDINLRLHLIITQVYDQLSASEVKLTLMEVLPDEYPITLVVAAGVEGEQQIQSMPLYELDHLQGTFNLAAVYVPPVRDENLLNRQFSKLREIIRILRSPEGCPWDREQTHQSIRKNLLEETYEVLETIDDEDMEGMCEEMGDLLMQVMLHAQIAEDEGDFTVEDIIYGLNEKLIRRHPHVFGEVQADTSAQVVQNWEQIKASEKKEKGQERKSHLSGIPRDLPALMFAYKLQKKAAHVGFDWDNVQDVYNKVDEEYLEVKEAKNKEELREEMGDLLFAVVNLARFLKIDPEEALALTNKKFTRRFHYIEERLTEQGKDFATTTLDEMELYWQEAKQKQREVQP